MSSQHFPFVNRTLELADKNVEERGQPFACVIVKNGKIVAEGVNLCNQTKNPTLHAEITAINKKKKKYNINNFDNCVFYVMKYACPMCMTAMYHCAPKKVIFIATTEEYCRYDTKDRKYHKLKTFYEEIGKLNYRNRNMPVEHIGDDRALKIFEKWQKLSSKL